MKYLILIFGLQGSGKSTQAKLYGQNHYASAYSMGDLLRNHPATAQIVADGSYADDAITNQIAVEKISECFESDNGVTDLVLDGYPRSSGQFRYLFLEEGCKVLERCQVIGFNFLIDPEVARQRLLQRGRKDDTEIGIAKRMKEYYQNMDEMLEHYSMHMKHLYTLNVTYYDQYKICNWVNEMVESTKSLVEF